MGPSERGVAARVRLIPIGVQLSGALCGLSCLHPREVSLKLPSRSCSHSLRAASGQTSPDLGRRASKPLMDQPRASRHRHQGQYRCCRCWPGLTPGGWFWKEWPVLKPTDLYMLFLRRGNAHQVSNADWMDSTPSGLLLLLEAPAMSPTCRGFLPFGPPQLAASVRNLGAGQV